MRSPHPPLKSIPLPLQILLARVRDRHIARVYREPRLARLGAEVVVRRARVPDEQVAGLGADFEPLAALFLEPLHAGGGEAVPFGRPGGDAWLGGHFLVELGGEEVCARADDEAAVVGAVGEEVDEALETAEVGLCWVLVLVWPGLVGWEVCAAVLCC